MNHQIDAENDMKYIILTGPGLPPGVGAGGVGFGGAGGVGLGPL